MMDPENAKVSIDPQTLQVMNSALDKALSSSTAEFSHIEDQFSIRQLLEKRIVEMMALGEDDEHLLSTDAVSWLRRTLHQSQP